MSRFSNFLKSIVPPTNQAQQTASTNQPNNDSGAKPFVPKTNVWTPNIPPKKTLIDNSKQLPSTEKSEGKTVNVPVHQNDTEWQVIQRGLGIMADEAGVIGDSKLAFVKKWSGEVERTGQALSHSGSSTNSSAEDNFAIKIDKASLSQATLWMETYPLTIRPDFEARANSDLQALRHVEMFGVNVQDPRLRSEVKANLRQIIVGTSEEQAAAAQKLLQKAQKGQPEADKIYEVTKALSCIGEMRFNAALNMAKIKMDSDKFQQLGQQQFVESRPHPKMVVREEAAVAAPLNKRDYRNNKIIKRDNAKQAQAKWVDDQVSKILSNFKID